ncbi:MAG: hypothetical protein WCE68_00505 [Anaerolineales bacterium]
MGINFAPGLGRRSTRLKNWDYSQPGGYYITLVTFQREHLFGKIVKNEMQLNESGGIVRDVWRQLPIRYPNVVMDEMIVMPNHCHGILFILDDLSASSLGAVYPGHPVGAIHELPLPDAPPPDGIHVSPAPYNESSDEYRLRRRRMLIPKMVGYFKMNTAKTINLLLNSSGVPVWQRNYYEHIIRDAAEYTRIARYIIKNPVQWETDEENCPYED